MILPPTLLLEIPGSPDEASERLAFLLGKDRTDTPPNFCGRLNADRSYRLYRHFPFLHLRAWGYPVPLAVLRGTMESSGSNTLLRFRILPSCSLALVLLLLLAFLAYDLTSFFADGPDWDAAAALLLPALAPAALYLLIRFETRKLAQRFETLMFVQTTMDA